MTFINDDPEPARKSFRTKAEMIGTLDSMYLTGLLVRSPVEALW